MQVSKVQTGEHSEFEAIFGCILGTALGDAAGLKREGLSRDRAIKLHGVHPSPDLIFGRGYCSDDTEHTLMVGCAMLESGGDVELFKKRFASYLRKWVLLGPAGIGLGTLKAVLKSFIFGPDRSGVGSAGNGPAMRAGILGLLASGDSHLVELVNASTRITHTDSRAIEGALIIARAARFARANPNRDPIEFINDALTWIEGDEMLNRFRAIQSGLNNEQSPQQYVDENFGAKGVSGYINNTVPAAIYAWAATPDDFQKTVETSVLFGGDTDSVAAIAGSISGAANGASRLPAKWIEQLGEWPRDVEWMKNLSKELCTIDQVGTPAPSMRWGRTAIRNFLFAIVVLLMFGLRYVRFLLPFFNAKPQSA